MLWPTIVVISHQSGQLQTGTLHPLASMVPIYLHCSSTVMETPGRARYKTGVQDDRYHLNLSSIPQCVQPAEGVLTVTGSARIQYVDDDGKANRKCDQFYHNGNGS